MAQSTSPPPLRTSNPPTRSLRASGKIQRPPKALAPRKATHAAECEQLEQLPNIGPAMAADLRLIGVQHPQELTQKDAFALYQALCQASGQRQDPCVLDVFIAATDFMRGAPALPWWHYTAQRKSLYGQL